jgi:hypothetical protein
MRGRTFAFYPIHPSSHCLFTYIKYARELAYIESETHPFSEKRTGHKEFCCTFVRLSIIQCNLAGGASGFRRVAEENVCKFVADRKPASSVVMFGVDPNESVTCTHKSRAILIDCGEQYYLEAKP